MSHSDEGKLLVGHGLRGWSCGRGVGGHEIRRVGGQWAFNSLRTSPWASDAFRTARTERGQRYHRALRGIVARWMRVLWTCWTNGTTYDPTKHACAAQLAR